MDGEKGIRFVMMFIVLVVAGSVLGIASTIYNTAGATVTVADNLAVQGNVTVCNSQINGVWQVCNISNLPAILSSCTSGCHIVIHKGMQPTSTDFSLVSNLTIENYGTIYYANGAAPTTYGSSTWMFKGLGVQNVTFLNYGLIAPKMIFDPVGTQEIAVYFNDSKNIRVTAGDMYKISGGVAADRSTDITIDSLNADHVSQYGVGFSCSQDVKVSNIYVNARGSSATEAVESNGYSRNIKIDNVRLDNETAQEVVDSSSDQNLVATNIYGHNVYRLVNFKNISDTITDCDFNQQDTHNLSAQGTCFGCTDVFDIDAGVPADEVYLDIQAKGFSWNYEKQYMGRSEKSSLNAQLVVEPSSTNGMIINQDGSGYGMIISTANRHIVLQNTSDLDQWHIELGGTNDQDIDFVETGVASNRLYLKAGGNVGINTNNPAEKLDVQGGNALLGDVRVAETSGVNYIQSSNNRGASSWQALRFTPYQSATYYFQIDGSGIWGSQTTNYTNGAAGYACFDTNGNIYKSTGACV